MMVVFGANVDVWSVIFSHVEWDSVEHYKKLSRLCKTFYKACRLGAAQYFRWDAVELLNKRDVLFFRNSVRAVTVTFGDQYKLIRKLLPDINDVRILIPSSNIGNFSIFNCEKDYPGIEHLYFHAQKGTETFSVYGPLPKGLKSFGMTHDNPFVDAEKSTVLELPEELPNSLLHLRIIGCVCNGVVDDLLVPELPASLKRFEYIGIHADDRFFKTCVPLDIEEIKIVSGENDCLYLQRRLSLRLEKLRKLTLISNNHHGINEFDVDLTRYPSLEKLTFNDGMLDNINCKRITAIYCENEWIPHWRFEGCIDSSYTVVKFDIREESVLETKTKKIKI